MLEYLPDPLLLLLPHDSLPVGEGISCTTPYEFKRRLATKAHPSPAYVILITFLPAFTAAYIRQACLSGVGDSIYGGGSTSVSDHGE